MSEYIGNLPAANPSPRIMGGVIKWYEGDTFELYVVFELEDQDGEAITIQPGHTVEFVFKNKKREQVYSVVFENIEDNCVKLDFDKKTSELFPKGQYTYDVYYNGAERKTLANDAPVLVE